MIIGKTQHRLYSGLAQNMSSIEDNSIELVVTSPPYPMINMWDEIMSKQNPAIENALKCNDGNRAFELMHQELDKVWNEVSRVLIPGGIVCINIGDATRTINGNFSLYPNHARIINYFVRNGFVNLPNIIWRKQTNAPNKFMGSGMLPAGAYVTLEHEWILIFRKGEKREFKKPVDKQKRRESSFFWEERNVWFSDLWDNIKGTKQKAMALDSRERSAAYPLDIPFRLINMYSLQGDTVLDPFIGTGTTTIAALMSNRNSVGYDVDSKFIDLAIDNICTSSVAQINDFMLDRIRTHSLFVEERMKTKDIKHFNTNLNLPVMTSQETDMKFSYLSNIEYTDDDTITVNYQDSTQLEPVTIVTRKGLRAIAYPSQTAIAF